MISFDAEENSLLPRSDEGNRILQTATYILVFAIWAYYRPVE